MNTSLTSVLPCRKADLMSVVFTVQCSGAAIDRNSLIVPFPTVGLPLGYSRVCSFKPLTTNRALELPSLVVITYLVDNVFCPKLATS